MIPAWETSWWSKRMARNNKVMDDDFEFVTQSQMRFDCRKLNCDFMLDTGRQMVDELANGHVLPKLPYMSCVLQFNDCWVHFCECTYHAHVHGSVDDDGTGIDYISARVCTAADPDPTEDDDLMAGELAIYEKESWETLVKNRVQEGEYLPAFWIANGNDDDTSAAEREQKAIMAFGLFGLMEERLLRQAIVKGTTITRNARKMNAGSPLSLSYRVVTLNLAETRRRSKGRVLYQHESPMLHWRRGHWRTLHRGSEFEGRTWVRRCLVGDPDRGFVSKHYRAIWQQKIH